MHPPESHSPPPRTLADFLRAYAMIVLSILTALALERAVVAYTDRTAAARSREHIEAELALNVAELKQSLAHNRAARDTANQIVGKLIELLKASRLDEAALRAVFARPFNLGLEFPTWRREAWEAAIADQSASHLAPRDLRRYAEIFTASRDVADVEHFSLGPELSRSIAELMLSVRLNQPDARLAATLALRFQIISQDIINTEQALLDTATKS